MTTIRARVVDLEARRPRRPLADLPVFETEAERIAWEDAFVADTREKLRRAAPEDADLVEKIEECLRVIVSDRQPHAESIRNTQSWNRDP